MFKLVGGITLRYRTLLHEFKEVSWAQSAELLTFAALLIPTILYTCKEILLRYRKMYRESLRYRKM